MPIRRALIAAAAAAAALTAATAAAEPVDPRPPTVTVDVRGGELHVRGHRDAAAGYARLRFRARDIAEPYTLAVIELDRGRTAADVAEIPLAGLQDAERVEEVGRLVAGATLHPGDVYATRVVLRDRRFVVVDVTHEDQRSVSFRLGGDGDGVRAGHHDAAVTIRDDGLSVPDALPRKGLVKIANRGDDAHALVALRLPRGTTTAQARRRVRDGAEPARIGRRFDLLGVVSAGTVNRVEVDLPRGRYLLVSFHAALKGPDSDVARGILAGVRVV